MDLGGFAFYVPTPSLFQLLLSTLSVILPCCEQVQPHPMKTCIWYISFIQYVFLCKPLPLWHSFLFSGMRHERYLLHGLHFLVSKIIKFLPLFGYIKNSIIFCIKRKAVNSFCDFLLLPWVRVPYTHLFWEINFFQSPNLNLNFSIANNVPECCALGRETKGQTWIWAS